MLNVRWERCPFCSRQDIYISAPKHLWEEVAILVLLQPVRCYDCMRRFFRPVFASPPPKMPLRRVASKEPARKEASVMDKGHAINAVLDPDRGNGLPRRTRRLLSTSRR
jgi:hypothetical protein